jgi:hypothetical protein
MAHTTEQLNEWFRGQMSANSANVYYQIYPATKESDQQLVTASVPKDDLAQLPEDLVFLRLIGGLPLFVR